MSGNMLSEEELDDLLSRASLTRPVDPAARDDESADSALDGVWQRVATRARETPSRAPVYRRRWAVAGAAVAAVGVASLIGVESLTGGAGTAGLSLAVSPAAAAQLDRVSHAAAAQPGLSAGQWQYVERTSQARNANGNSYGTVRVQDWFAANGVERERESLAGAVTSDHVYTNPSQGYAPTPGVNLASPPSDVQTLLSDIAGSTLFHGVSPADHPGGYWVVLANVLLRSTSPQLRSLAFTALGYLPGVTVSADQTDELGRAGTAFSFTDSGAGRTFTIVVSPSTGEMLESYETTTRAAVVYRRLPAGAVVDRIIYTRQTVVSSDTALPGGGTQPLTASEPTTTTPATPTPVQALTVPVAPSPTPPTSATPQSTTTTASR